MNHLAHLYLSGSDPDLLLGNFIADAVKGKQVDLFAPGVQNGIRLHRAIDTFTDAHPVVRQTKAHLYAGYSKFAGVILDIYFDHFLAVSWATYHEQPLASFVDDFYQLIQNRWTELPEKVQHFAPYMIQHNWLLNYAKLDGIGRSLTGLSQRVKNAGQLQFAVNDLERDFELFKSGFDAFFPELQKFVQEQILAQEQVKQGLPLH